MRIISWAQSVIYPNLKSSSKIPDNGVVDFDDAIAATGFGKFNILLMLYAIPAAAGCMFDTTIMSYVITSAECDLQLSYMNKGFLNGITHLGMITSALIYGYLADTLGRKNILIYGFLLDACCNICAAFSQNFLMLVMLKFFTGFLVGGPCTVLVTCLSEFFHAAARPMFSMYIGICFSIGNVILPFIAMFMLSNPSDYLIGSFLVMHSWQVFIAICSLPSFCTGCLAMLLPESPRFLLSRGRKEDALNVLKKVYAFNNNCSPDNYPIKDLKSAPGISMNNNIDQDIEEIKENKDKESALSALRGGLLQMRPLFFPPHLPIVLLIFVLEFGCMTGSNTLRLWLPQLFKMMSESDETKTSLCEMISINETVSISAPTLPESGECSPIKINPETFTNTAMVYGAQVIFCILSSLIINAVGNKKLLCATFSIAGVCSLALYWCTNTIQATIFAGIAVSFNAITSNAIMSVVVNLFPTSLKAMVTSATLMVGRVGSITGNIIFPILLAAGCLTPFLTLGSMLLGCSLLSITIPKAKKGII